MPVPTIQIPNPLLHGDYLRSPIRSAAYAAGIPPTLTVKLGAILLPPEKKPHLIRFAAVRAAGKAMTPPAKTTWAAKADAAIRRMYANDRLGCCTFSALFGLVGGWTANDTPVCVTVPDAEVVANYMRYGASPGRDEGSIPSDVMAAWKAGKITVNGKPDGIAGFVTVDWTNVDETKDAIFLFGGLHLNIDLPKEWADNPREWATQQNASRIVGGHSVVVIDYDERGVTIRTWGSTRFMPWSVLTRLNRNTEVYAVLSPDWTNDDRLAPCGVDVTKLTVALSVLGQGGLPDEPTPVPPPSPPSPPTPPVPVDHPTFDITLHGWFGSMTGTAVPRAAGTFGHPDQPDPFAPNGFWIHPGSITPAAAINPVAILTDLYAVFTAYKTGSIPAVEAAVRQLLVDLGVLHPAAAFAWGDGSILKALIELAEKLLPLILPLILKSKGPP